MFEFNISLAQSRIATPSFIAFEQSNSVPYSGTFTSMLFVYIIYTTAVSLVLNALNTLNKDSAVHRLWSFSVPSLDVSRLFATLKSLINSTVGDSSSPITLDYTPLVDLPKPPRPVLGYCTYTDRCLGATDSDCDHLRQRVAAFVMDSCPSPSWKDASNITVATTEPELPLLPAIAAPHTPIVPSLSFEAVFIASLLFGFLTIICLALFLTSSTRRGKWEFAEVCLFPPHQIKMVLTDIRTLPGRPFAIPCVI